MTTILAGSAIQEILSFAHGTDGKKIHFRTARIYRKIASEEQVSDGGLKHAMKHLRLPRERQID